MPSSTHDPNHLLAQLEAAKSRFDSSHAGLITRLLSQCSKLQFIDPHQLIRFHEVLLFLRAFPHAPSLIPRVEHLLDTFHKRVGTLRAAKADMSIFDDLGLDEMDLGALSGNLDLFPDEVLASIARRLGFGPALERALDSAIGA